MGSVTDQLLSGDIGGQDKEKPRRSVVDQLLEGGPGVKGTKATIGGEEGVYPLQTGREPTGAISTITGEPISRPVDVDTGQKPGFGAMVEQGFVDDPGTKMDILSKRMGIPRERFGVAEGKIVYLADDGKLYPAMPSGRTPGGYGRLGAGMVSHGPEIALGSLAAPAGPGAAFLGAAGGEGIRKSIGNLAYGEPQTISGNVKDMAVAGTLGAAGEKLARTGIGLHDVARGRKAAGLMKLAGREVERMNPADVRRIKGMADDLGIELWTPELTRSNELAARFRLLGDLPVTADKVGQLRMKRYKEINDAVQNWLDSFAPPSTTAESAGREAVGAAKEGIGAAKAVRQAKARPLYKKAYKTTLDEDVAEGLMGDPAIKGAVNRVRKDPVYSRELKSVDENNLQVFDLAKRQIDDQIKAAQRKGNNNRARILQESKDYLVEVLDETSPDYKKARQVFGDESEAVEQLTGKKQTVGKLASLEGNDIEKAADYAFAPSKSSPEVVRRVKEVVKKRRGKKAWDALLRTHLKGKLRDVAKTDTGNLGGQLRKKLFSDLDQREILQEAMTPTQFKNFENLMEVLERTAITTGQESTSIPRAFSASQMSEEAGGFLGKAQRVVSHPLYSWKRGISDWRARLRSEKYQEKLLDAMTDERTTGQLQRMLQLKPGSRKFLTQLGTFLAIVGGIQGREKAAESTRRDVLPSMRPPRGTTPRRTR